MHSYLRAIGFSKYTKKAQVEELLNEAVDNPDEQNILTGYGEDTQLEVKKMYSSDIGIIWRGTVLEDGTVDMDFYYPFIKPKTGYVIEETQIVKKLATTAFTGACDDIRLGVSLVFYLLNGMDYMELLANNFKLNGKQSLAFSALSTSGTILFPISKTESEKKKLKADNEKRKRLLMAARNGDEEAIESLTMGDLDLYTKLSARIVKEDVFTIVDNSLMPYSIECDLYTIVADIDDVELMTNKITGEEMYKLYVSCNDIKVELLINRLDLIGEPMKSRRFKGTIWLQAFVNFTANSKRSKK